MGKEGDALERWLDEASIPQTKRTPDRMAVFKAAYAFLEQAGRDYASQRILAHFLLNSELDLKLAQIARLVGVTRPTASRQNKLSSREVVRQIQQQMSGRPYGKLLPRYAGPIAHFLVTHPEASRDDVVDFVGNTWNIRVGRTALYEFLKKYGLDRESLDEAKSSEPPHLVTDEQAAGRISSKIHPRPALRWPRSPKIFFRPDPIRRRLPLAPTSAPLVGPCPTVLL